MSSIHWFNRRHQNGSALMLEALAALAIGSYTGAAIAMNLLRDSTRSNAAAHYAQATLLAQEMAERMRINAAAARAGHYHSARTAVHDGCYTPRGCTAEQRAQDELARWQQTINAQLPQALGRVCLDLHPGNDRPCEGSSGGTLLYEIRIQWRYHDQDDALWLPLAVAAD